MLPGLTKAGCLRAFAALRPARMWRAVSPGSFLSGVGLLPFLLTAGQAAKSLTGYGIVLGGIMGAVTDFGWGLVQRARGGSVRIEGPPPSDPLGKAVRYILQPAYHAAWGQLFSFEEHMMLAAADSVAAQIIMQQSTAAQLAQRWPEMADVPVLEFSPWSADSLEAMRRAGINAAAPFASPMDGLGFRPTYRQALTAIAAAHEAWWPTIASEFPRAAVSQEFSSMVSETGKAILEWMGSSPGSIQPIFEPEEIALARMIETGVFPVDHVFPETLELAIGRALEIAGAGGRSLPQRDDLVSAVTEIFGGVRGV